MGGRRGWLATASAIVVLWRRWQRDDPWADEGTARSSAEPRLARVVELFGVVAILRVALDWVD